jgi:hypothetical protein
VDLASGGRLALGGFKAVSLQKLKALPGEKLASLSQTDELELLYLHLYSMRNFSSLRDRLAVAEGGNTTQEGTATAISGDRTVSDRPERTRSDGEDAHEAATG